MAGAHVGKGRAAGLLRSSELLPAASLRAPQRHAAPGDGTRQAKLPSRRQARSLQCSRKGRDRVADRRLAAALVCAAGSAALDAGAGWSSADSDADAAAASAVQEVCWLAAQTAHQYTNLRLCRHSLGVDSKISTLMPLPVDAQSMGNATFFQSVVNVINILSGVGLLSLPFALRKSGWAGLGVLWLMGFVTNYTGA